MDDSNLVKTTITDDINIGVNITRRGNGCNETSPASWTRRRSGPQLG